MDCATHKGNVTRCVLLCRRYKYLRACAKLSDPDEAPQLWVRFDVFDEYFSTGRYLAGNEAGLGGALELYGHIDLLAQVRRAGGGGGGGRAKECDGRSRDADIQHGDVRIS